MEDIMIKRCRESIEAKLGWGDSSTWTTVDFDKLSEKIFESTETNLSTATLKRIWGKVKYENALTITTLNTLAHFLGYENWRAYVNEQQTAIPAEPATTTQKSNVRWLALFLLAVGVISVFGFYLINKEDTNLHVDTSAYSFTSEKMINSGVPNSVVFEYDASAAPTDSVFIQQSWDERLSKKVSREGKHHTAIYYVPGMFNAKLIVGKQIVKEHKVFITTDGWIAIIDRSPTPFYFKKEDFYHDGGITVPIDVVKASGVPFEPNVPYVSIGNVMDFDTLSTDNFVLETRLKNTYQEGNAPCGHTRILVLVEGAPPITIPLSKKGCISELKMTFADKFINGETADLSALGCNMDQWVDVKCEVKDSVGKIFVNDVLSYKDTFDTKRKILGIVAQFQGTGVIDRVKLSLPDSTVILDDNF